MTVKVEGNNLVITLPFDKDGKDSASKKSLIHATTGGAEKTEVMVGGKPLQVSVNAYTSKK